ncbi:hypothetical protein CPB84DRAFT_1672002 [Gymnopilus junonius]|uniref:Carbohydrate esterase family 16 protein n=1 Tax=Gymnopilus junonius TaxID=109634 RepID=A0A9P5TTJ5_GYMJU|nr:hypothetical protein CPB84DRAFT_1672002 [Gymnopilus junonius]
MWNGFAGVRRLIIFGDSYSAVQFTPRVPGNSAGRPTAQQPLGVEFPGYTFNEDGLPNWVGHLISKHCPEPRFNPNGEQGEEWIKSPLLVHDYAKGGDIVQGIQRQFERLFLPDLSKRPDWAPWTESQTLFITWVGINDCALGLDPRSTIKHLFSIQEKLFEIGARNFMFIDVPTVHRIPLQSDRQSRVQALCENWNQVLRQETNEFHKKHKDATVLLFSAWKVFDTLLDDPGKLGFDPEDVHRRGGSIWVDHLHPTSKVHSYMAQCIAVFLHNIPSNPGLSI